jgi:branched-chain amino acid aminotransferase
METINDITIEKVKHSKISEINKHKLDFGKYVSDHMFVCTYKKEQWQGPQILPFANLSLSPATLALHYGQSVFEGMKAFYRFDGRINIFRLEKHHERFNKSLHRMCMPQIPFELFETALMQLVTIDKKWIPQSEGSALYIRPFVFASEARLGVNVSEEYQFLIISCPVGSYFQKPLKVKVERTYVRAAAGGTGFAKCAGNYGGAFYPTHLAKQQGFDQVLWTDAHSNEYIEESGMMNVLFVIDGKLITPPLSDTILDGVTRDSLLQIARDFGIEVEERPISIKEIKVAFKEGRITEAFGAGTAAVTAPIAVISIDDRDFSLEKNEWPVMHFLKKQLEAIRLGIEADKHGWNFNIG